MSAEPMPPLPPVPPHNIEAEECLLSCCLLDGSDTIKRCIESKLPGAAFYSPANRLVYERALELHRQSLTVDVALLAQSLVETKQLDAIGGFPFLTQITGRVPTTAQASVFIEKIRECYTVRETIKAAQGIVD